VFITSKRSTTRSGLQKAQGRFLILMRPDTGMVGEMPIRAIVRFVKMEQVGHFMMGSVKIAGHEITLSGTYGDDGLTCTVPTKVYLRGVPLPFELQEAWKNGGGHNEAGREGLAMKKWALETFKKEKG
jgi:hypothetical protein